MVTVKHNNTLCKTNGFSMPSEVEESHRPKKPGTAPRTVVFQSHSKTGPKKVRLICSGSFFFLSANSSLLTQFLSLQLLLSIEVTFER
jgi:hypothetical protein